MILGGAGGLALSAWSGYLYGVRCRRLPASRYWMANAAGLLVGFVLASLGTWAGMAWLWVGGLGVMAGSMTGLKYGLGRSMSLPPLGNAARGVKRRR